MSSGYESETEKLSYQNITTEEELIDYSRDYLYWCVDHYNVTIDKSHLYWEVTKRAKRRAAAVKLLI